MDGVGQIAGGLVSGSGSLDAANIIKPALTQGAIRKHCQQTIEKDGAPKTVPSGEDR